MIERRECMRIGRTNKHVRREMRESGVKKIKIGKFYNKHNFSFLNWNYISEV
jgi:hypothetical protein